MTRTVRWAPRLIFTIAEASEKLFRWWLYILKCEFCILYSADKRHQRVYFLFCNKCKGERSFPVHGELGILAIFAKCLASVCSTKKLTVQVIKEPIPFFSLFKAGSCTKVAAIANGKVEIMIIYKYFICAAHCQGLSLSRWALISQETYQSFQCRQQWSICPSIPFLPHVKAIYVCLNTCWLLDPLWLFSYGRTLEWASHVRLEENKGTNFLYGKQVLLYDTWIFSFAISRTHRKKPEKLTLFPDFSLQ